jgi:threonine/homoserine/homoserine lactone efflux protein
MSVEYLLTSLIVCLSPGIGVVFTLSSTLAGGFRAGLWASIGCTIATILHMAVAMAGLATILYTSALLFQGIKFAGTAYLLWMAWAVIKDRGTLSIRAGSGGGALELVRRGILLNILNPKLPLFFVAFLPQFMPPGSGLPILVELGVVFSGTTFVVFMGYVLLAVTGRRRLLGSERVMTWLRRLFAASFVALGLKLTTETAR